MRRKSINILGVTGSIGRSAADVILSDAARFDVGCVTAHTNVEALAEQAVLLKAKRAVIADESKYSELKNLLSGTEIEAAAGENAIEEAASYPVELTLAAIVGIAGLKPIMRAIEQGKCVAIANKEPLVAAGPLVMAAAKRHGTTLLPVDSEHNAIFQVFDFENKNSIEKIILTASGGPFLKFAKSDLINVTPEQAVAHPNWSMGKKISIDSATMMNKALEIIEASYLFDMPGEKISVLIHPQSVVHSMIEYSDGSVLAQMGASDMRTPIAYALAWPERMKTPGQKLDLAKLSKLTFEEPDYEQFPALTHAYGCLKKGLYAGVALNAANEVAVEAFLTNHVVFTDIMTCVEDVLAAARTVNLESIEDVIRYDQEIKQAAQSRLAGSTKRKTVAR